MIALETQRSSLQFNGAGYIAVTTTVKDVIHANGQYTFEMFVRAMDSERNHQLLQRAPSGYDRHGLAIGSDGKPRLSHYAGSWKAVVGPAITWGEWAHIAATFNTRADMRIYVNGVQGTLGTYVYAYPYSDIMIARSSTYYSDGFIGEIAYVRIYNRPLSQQEIMHNMLNPDTPTFNSFPDSRG